MEEHCWAIAQAVCLRAAADHVPVCWSLDFTWTSFICIYTAVDRMHNQFRVRKLPHVPHPPEPNYCGIREVSLQILKRNVNFLLNDVSSSARTASHRKLDGMWRENLVAYHEVLFRHFHKTTERPRKLVVWARIISQDFLTSKQHCCPFDPDIFSI